MCESGRSGLVSEVGVGGVLGQAFLTSSCRRSWVSGRVASSWTTRSVPFSKTLEGRYPDVDSQSLCGLVLAQQPQSPLFPRG